MGLVSEARLRRVAAEGAGTQIIREIVDRRSPVEADQRLLDAVVLMDREETRQLAVIDQAGGALVGMLTMSDIVRAQMRVARTLPCQPRSSQFQRSRRNADRANLPFSGCVCLTKRNIRPANIRTPTVHYHLIQLGPDAPAIGQAVAVLKLPQGTFIVTVERQWSCFRTPWKHDSR